MYSPGLKLYSATHFPEQQSKICMYESLEQDTISLSWWKNFATFTQLRWNILLATNLEDWQSHILNVLSFEQEIK